MKKLLFILSALLMLSCSSSDDNSKETTNGDFHPPAWLIGTWKFGDNTGSISFTFSPDNICSTNYGVGQCQKQLIDFARKGSMTVNVVEIITDKNYSAEIKYSNGQSTTYAFKKISNNSIEWTNASGSVFIKQ